MLPHGTLCLPCVQDFVEKSRFYAESSNPGYQLPDEKFNLLNRDEGLQEAISILECAFRRWGIEGTLAFVRQGRDGFDPDKPGDWRQQCNFVGVAGSQVSGSNKLVFNICEYLRCIKRYMRYICENPDVWHNAYRPDIPCRHI